MKSILKTLFLFICPALNLLYAQAGQPAFYGKIPSWNLPVFSVQPSAIDANRGVLAPEDKILQIGVPVPVSLSLSEEGVWLDSAGAQTGCLLRIHSAGASHINLLFSGLVRDSHFQLYVYSSTMEGLHRIEVLEHELGASIPVAGEELIIEYNGPKNLANSIRIDYIVHGIRDFRRVLLDYGQSGSCNVNVNCPEGAGWSQQASGVVMILTQLNSRYCSGALINNVSHNGTPYLLTAAHCEPAVTDLFLFNYQSANCSNSEGPLDQIVQGCKIRARNPGTDFCLVEINYPSMPIETFLCGWDRSKIPPMATTTIHHPEGDIKKITSNTDVAGTAPYLGAVCWHISDYESGTTESGSSGAPLFNPDKRIIGQLYGGWADCTDNVDDYYGKFSASWIGNSSEERLSNWLDPAMTGTEQLDGVPFQFERFDKDLRLVQLKNLPDVICKEMISTAVLELKNMGIDTLQGAEIRYRFNEGPEQSLVWNYPIAPLASVEIPINIPDSYDAFLFQGYIQSIQPGNDMRPANDTLRRAFRIADGQNFVFSIFSDERSTETSFTLYNDSNEELFSLPPESLGDEAEFNFYFCLPPGCYTLKIQDMGGDGICCSHGNGAYYLYNSLDQQVFTGGNFGAQKSEFFCVDSSLSIQVAQKQGGIHVFPVPSSDRRVWIQVPENWKATGFRMVDLSGRVVFNGILEPGKQAFDFQSLNPGMYILEWESGSGVHGTRLVLGSLP